MIGGGDGQTLSKGFLCLWIVRRFGEVDFVAQADDGNVVLIGQVPAVLVQLLGGDRAEVDIALAQGGVATGKS